MIDDDKIADPAHFIAQEDPRLTIYKEIETYRSKLSEYEQLQKQLNELNQHLNASEVPPIDAGKLSKMKSDRGKGAVSTTKRNSHKKIKIYELQKKYDKVLKDHEQKKSNFEKNIENHNKILWQIEDLSKKIEDQKKTSENLKQLSFKIQNDLEVIGIKIERQVLNLEESVKTKELCNHERKKIRDNIKRTRMMIHNITNNLTEDLEASSSEQEEKGHLNSDQSIRLPQPNLHAADMQIWMDKQTKRIEVAFGKYEHTYQKNQGYLQNFYSSKKEMISNQLLVKHHKVTIALQTTKVKEYESHVKQFRQKIVKRSQIAQQMTAKINKLDGQRGFLRGKIGIKIEQQRAVRAVNSLIEQDLIRVRAKLGYLKFLKRIVQERME